MNRTIGTILAGFVIASAVAAPPDNPNNKGKGKGRGSGGDPPPVVEYNSGVLKGSQLNVAPLQDVSVARKSKPAIKPAELLVHGGKAPARTFLKFEVAGVQATILSAKLLLRSTTNSAGGGELRPVDTSWPQTLSWWNQPYVDFASPALDSVGPVGRDGYYEWDVGQYVTGDGGYAFALTCESCSSKYASSRAGPTPPYLVIVTDDGDIVPPGDPGDPVLVGAGDIARCGGDPFQSGAETTAMLLDGIDGVVFTAGDNAYPEGAAAEFADCYDPTWGRHRYRTRPAPGNHEYMTAEAAGYFGYFGDAAAPPDGYYSFELGDWHVIALNSQCIAVGGCGAGSPMEQWLRADLAAHSTLCAAVYMHRSRFSSGRDHGSDATLEPLVRAMEDGGVDLLVTAHDHLYERFAPQDSTGLTDLPDGIRMFVIGTGGGGPDQFYTPVANSEARFNGEYGVLKLTLHAGSYDWEFVGVQGQFTDTGSAQCR